MLIILVSHSSSFTFFFSFFKVILWRDLAVFSQISDYNCKTVFPKLYLFFFLFLGQYYLETCVNRVANCVTQKFTHLRFKFYKYFFSMSFYGQFGQFFHIIEPTISKQFFLNLNYCFLFQAPWCDNCVTN